MDAKVESRIIVIDDNSRFDVVEMMLSLLAPIVNQRITAIRGSWFVIPFHVCVSLSPRHDKPRVVSFVLERCRVEREAHKQRCPTNSQS